MEGPEEVIQRWGDINALDANGQHCLQRFALRVALKLVPPGQEALLAHKLRSLLVAGADVALASTVPVKNPVDLLLWELHRGLGPTCELPGSYPELISTLVEAGCPVDSPVPGHPDVYVHAVSIWFSCVLRATRLAQRQHGAWPRALHPTALDATGALLRGAARERPEGRPEFLDDALRVGDLGLVRLVLAAFPAAPGWLLGRDQCADGWQAGLDHFLDGRWHTATYTPVEAALKHFADGLVQLREPAEGRWREAHAAPIMHLCQLVEMLLRVGCPPVPALVVEKEPAQRSGRTFLPSLDGAPAAIRLPGWAREPLRHLLPLVARDEAWSLETHSAFPTNFRAVAQALLLINQHSGFGGGARESEQCAGRSVQCTPAQGGVHLPAPLLLHVLSLAAEPLPACVPQLFPFLPAGGA